MVKLKKRAGADRSGTGSMLLSRKWPGLHGRPGGWGADDIRIAHETGPFGATRERIEAEFGHGTA
jgi:hypothetical protein